jgi:hypothetical protein
MRPRTRKTLIASLAAGAVGALLLAVAQHGLILDQFVPAAHAAGGKVTSPTGVAPDR